jgi:Tfp pilus assembly protein PilE
LISQHAGEDKWEKELKQQETFMKTRIWKGNSNFSLEKFIEQHRAAYISMQQCSLHVTFQLPDEHTRVCYLINAIQCSDPELQATLAAVRADKTGPNAKRNDFENCVTILLPADPVSKKRKANNDGRGGVANISSASGKANGQNPHTGQTGVEFRYHTKQEYGNLTDEQKLELKEWRASNKQTNGKGTKRKQDETSDTSSMTAKELRSTIASVFREERSKQQKLQKKDEEEINEIRDLLATFKDGNDKPAKATVASASGSATSDATTVLATQLQGIFKRNSTPDNKKSG